jgi:hypothetical protein
MTKHITQFFPSHVPSDANALTTKGNVELYLDKELVEKTKDLGLIFQRRLKTTKNT